MTARSVTRAGSDHNNAMIESLWATGVRCLDPTVVRATPSWATRRLNPFTTSTSARPTQGMPQPLNGSRFGGNEQNPRLNPPRQRPRVPERGPTGWNRTSGGGVIGLQVRWTTTGAITSRPTGPIDPNLPNKNLASS